jgi:hypothetical protein
MSTNPYSRFVGIELTPRKTDAEGSKIRNKKLKKIQGQKLRIKKIHKKGSITATSKISKKEGTVATIWVEYVRIDERGKGNVGFLSTKDVWNYFGVDIPDSESPDLEL